MTIKVVCSWCGKHISGPRNADEETNTICPSCRKRQEKELNKLREQRGKR